MKVLGMSPSNSYLEIDAEEVRVRMGWTFSLVAPRASVGSAELDDRRVWGWGVHGWRGRWLVNGSSSGIVRFPIDPPVRARLLAIVPITVHEIRISLDDPSAAIDLLAA